jgi:hypothetical protein
MLDTLIKVVGVLGFFLASGSLLWHMWTYREGRKEKIEAEASVYSILSKDLVERRMEVGVRNAGHRPVYVSKVAIRYVTPASKQAEEAGGISCAHVGGEIALASVDDSKEPLQPGQGRVYKLPTEFIAACKCLRGLRRENLWLSISTPAGEVKRLSDLHTLMVIEQIANAEQKKADGSASPG